MPDDLHAGTPVIETGRSEAVRLLTSYVEQQDNGAFEGLVRIYGPMVYGVCRRTVPNHHDAEDAFQATFFILAKKAASIVHRKSLGVWLHGVARAVSRRAARVAFKRRRLETQQAERCQQDMHPVEQWSDVSPLIDEEVAKLPLRNRQAVVLCDLQGLDRKSAAKELGCSERTLSYRLTVGHERLAKRLSKRGVMLSALTLAVLLSEKAAQAAVSNSLVTAAVAAAKVAAGKAVPAGAMSSAALALARGVLASLVLLNALGGLLCVSVVCIVAGALWLRADDAPLARVPTADRPLIAPGPDTEAVIAFLQRIVDGQKAAAEPLRDRRVRGRTASVSALVPKNAQAPQRPDDVALPPLVDWQPFVDVHKGEKARFEMTLPADANAGRPEITSYRLSDGEAFYGLDGNSLDISPYTDIDRRWFELTVDSSLPLSVTDGVEPAPVSVVCRTHIDRLTRGEYFNESKLQLVCYVDDGKLVVELRKQPDFEDPARAFPHATFHVDPNLGYKLVRCDQEIGKPSGGFYSSSQTEVHYREVVPGVHFPSRATLKFLNAGAVALAQDRASGGMRQLEINSIELGDFEFDEQLFSWKSLPVPIRALVTDRRFDPPRTFVYGKAPLDEQVLAHAAATKPLVGSSSDARSWRWTWLFGANLFAVSAIAAAIFYRRRIGARLLR